ncbi:DUF441 domain-containing protein [Desulforamulus aeronauticus]|uniref:UPF0756 membrane protein SAMN02745123_00514 n=1 Tax=Desulforamulus aeronauticus DSM 10349 TaxID=1121421 RepID=A0A1M6PDH9_9FIRM|nr:DUF441 domain-containing protein [Desulforamulus aeronauticus]SHK05932.1 Uncharacterized membrane protein, DUF441 family [Desulforamulus aeronauticus DSM 10349]
MQKSNLILFSLLLLGFAAESTLLATAACILLFLKLSKLGRFLYTLERRGLEVGLIFLMLSVLVPLAHDNVIYLDMLEKTLSPQGILAIIGGALATHMNGEGLKLLKLDPQLIFGMVIGSIVGIVFLGGIPIGPLMAAGLTALFLEVIYWFK